MIVNGHDLGPMIPISVPEYPDRTPKVWQGWRATKSFVLFQNPRTHNTWTLANGHGRITNGFYTPGLAIEMAEALEETGTDWTLQHHSTKFYQTKAVKEVIDRFRHLRA